jgi:hypothetical protein
MKVCTRGPKPRGDRTLCAVSFLSFQREECSRGHSHFTLPFAQMNFVTCGALEARVYESLQHHFVFSVPPPTLT